MRITLIPAINPAGFFFCTDQSRMSLLRPVMFTAETDYAF
jgi:hypothetical protein